MATLTELLIQLVRVDSIWSIVIRALIWLIFVSIFAVGIAKGKQYSTIKSEAGFFVAFLILTGITIYLVFGIIPTVTAPSESKK